ncbi:MAG: bifunctional diaminohydroxyphosphoribosylaminopyrimidine deaminase/5-amino-6-(5-phosphoribosylamino)uracil reductase RibD [Planctomycetaceae bacterium]|nr:bifunctional diaminohydroxyphosphoribosylaminopyrimidine deaminase/5-amino-6-(5-phosphoribosylamino)uracil reductase RibD [Planctomycetaceae bacterium]
MTEVFADDTSVMQRALELAEAGRGYVEPNPLVGAVLVDEQRRLIAEGYHERFGGPHAEIHALQQAGSLARGAHLFVTLEPCNHHGKTPPCTEAVIAAGVRKVTIGCIDPAPHTQGQGVARLRAAGVDVEVGVLQPVAEKLLRPFTKRMTTGIPYVHAKWAMTLDGRIATRTGSSQWISCPQSREIVHRLRGRMDAILVGLGTVRADDPLLTARPPGPRTPLRVVVDSQGRISPDSRLVRSLEEGPVLLACGEDVPEARQASLRKLGVEVCPCPLTSARMVSLPCLMGHLGQQGFTNILVEGGAGLLGSFLDLRLIDEVHVFIAPKLIGGQEALPAVGGQGVADMAAAQNLADVEVRQVGPDLYVQGQIPLHRPGEESGP